MDRPTWQKLPVIEGCPRPPALSGSPGERALLQPGELGVAFPWKAALRLGLAITGESAGGERSSGEQRDELLWKEERQVRAQM